MTTATESCMCFGGVQTRLILDPANRKGPLIEERVPCPICRHEEWRQWAKKGKAIE